MANHSTKTVPQEIPEIISKFSLLLHPKQYMNHIFVRCIPALHDTPECVTSPEISSYSPPDKEGHNKQNRGSIQLELN